MPVSLQPVPVTAAVLSAAALLVALLVALAALWRVRRPTQHPLSPELSLALLREDVGRLILRLQVDVGDTWWERADERDLEQLDRALSAWDLVGWYAANGAVARGAVLDAFRCRIVDLWEAAYPYVLERREEQPGLWSNLDELYLDAYEGADGTAARGDDLFPAAAVSPRAPARSVSPDEAPTGEPVPAGEAVPAAEAPAGAPDVAPPAGGPDDAAEQPAAGSDEDRRRLWGAALRAALDEGPPAAGPRLPPPGPQIVDLTVDFGRPDGALDEDRVVDLVTPPLPGLSHDPVR